MNDAARDESTPRFSADFTRVLAGGWAWGIALAFLIPTGMLFLPVEFFRIVGATLPVLKIGPCFGEFVAGSLDGFLRVAGILATAFAVGAVIVPGRDKLSALFALAVGLWVVAVAVLCLGVFSMTAVPWAFCGLLCWLLPQPRQFFRRASAPAEKLDGWAKAMVACVVVAAVLNLAGTLAPPFEYDELEYHLGALADYRRIGHIAFLPHNFYSNMPQLTEMLYLLAGSAEAAKLLHWTFGLLTAATVFVIAGKLWSRRAGATAAAIFYCLPFVQDLSQTARVDLATTFFGTLAFGGLLAWWRENDRRWVWLAALAGGAAVATKWPAVAVVVLPAMLFLAMETRSLRLPVALGLLSLVGVAPWLLKNWLLTGNPVYPLLSNMMPSLHWSAAQAAIFAEKHYPSFDLAGLADFGRLAWEYSAREPRAVPLLLMLAPLVLLRRNVDASVRRAGWLLVAGYVAWWALTFRPWRFLFPVFPLAALVGAYACRDWMVRAAVSVVLGVALVTLAMNTMVDSERPERVPAQTSFLQHALGQTSRDEFVARVGNGALEPILWMNENLPATAKVLYFGEARAYYARHDVVWCTAFDRFPATNGVTHVYINFSELYRLHDHYGYPRGLEVEPLPAGMREVYRTRNAAVYEL